MFIDSGGGDVYGRGAAPCRQLLGGRSDSDVLVVMWTEREGGAEREIEREQQREREVRVL